MIPKQKRLDQYIKEHERLHKLFVENRFLFELERKNEIENCINQSRNKEQREDLEKLQNKVDKILKNSGSIHNRFVLMKMLLWDQFHDQFRPILNQFSKT